MIASKIDSGLSPLVSVIIPTYGHASLVHETLESVLTQSFEDFEIIVINDGSPDNVADIVAPYVKAGTIQYYEQENQGQSAARARGVTKAKGRYIAFLDDDDLWPLEKLAWQVDYLEMNPDIGMVAGTVNVFNETAEWLIEFPVLNRIGFSELFEGNPLVSPGQTLIRADTLRQALQLWDTSIWGLDDWDLYFCIAEVSKIVMQDRIALNYRVHGANASKQYARMLSNAKLVLDRQLRKEKVGRRSVSRRKGYHFLYKFAGRAIISQCRTRFLEFRLEDAMRSLGELKPLKKALLSDPILLARLIKHLVLG